MLEYDDDGNISNDTSLSDSSDASLSRDTGAGILELIARATNEKPVPIINDFDFITDACMCQWAWVVDLDREVLEAFQNHCTNYIAKFSLQGNDKLGLLKTVSFKDLPNEIWSFEGNFVVYDSEEDGAEDEGENELRMLEEEDGREEDSN